MCVCWSCAINEVCELNAHVEKSKKKLQVRQHVAQTIGRVPPRNRQRIGR